MVILRLRSFRAPLPAFLCALGVASATEIQARLGHTATCTYGQWAAPASIESTLPALRATRFPTIARAASITRGTRSSSSSRYVVGVAGYEATALDQEYPWPAVWPPELRIYDETGKRLSPPAGAHWFAYPRGAVDSRGALHVLWAEPDSAVPRRSYRGEEPRLHSIWYAQFRNGTWSRPARIFRSRVVKWDPLSASQLVVDFSGLLSVVFGAEDSTGWTLVHLSAVAADTPRWRARVWRFATPVVYASIATSKVHLAIAFIRAGDGADERPNVVYVMHMRRGDSGWSSPRAVSQPPQEPAIEPHIFARDSVFTVIWTSQPASSFAGGAVWRARLNAEWQAELQGSLRLEGITNSSSAAIDACGTAHFVVRNYTPAGARLAYARNDHNGWTSVTYPFASVSHPDLAASGDTLRLIWSSLNESSLGGPTARLMTSILPISRRIVSQDTP